MIIWNRPRETWMWTRTRTWTDVDVVQVDEVEVDVSKLSSALPALRPSALRIPVRLIRRVTDPLPPVVARAAAATTASAAAFFAPRGT